jgi:hypothetical protein
VWNQIHPSVPLEGEWKQKGKCTISNGNHIKGKDQQLHAENKQTIALFYPQELGGINEAIT